MTTTKREYKSEDGPIRRGAKVRLANPPGLKAPYSTVGVAEGAPDSSGLFWVQFPCRRMAARVSEVDDRLYWVFSAETPEEAAER